MNLSLLNVANLNDFLQPISSFSLASGTLIALFSVLLPSSSHPHSPQLIVNRPTVACVQLKSINKYVHLLLKSDSHSFVSLHFVSLIYHTQEMDHPNHRALQIHPDFYLLPPIAHSSPQPSSQTSSVHTISETAC